MTEALKSLIIYNLLYVDIDGYTSIFIDLLLPRFRGIM